MRKKFLLPLLMLCVGSFFAAAACESEEDTSPEEESTSIEITLSQENVQIQTYQEFLLTASYEGEETVVWTVADPTIVSVENGKLVGLKAGTTTVTVTAGSVTDTCTVTVSPLDEAKISLRVAEPNVSLYKDDQKQIEVTATYYGMALDEATKTYESSDSNVVSVDANGKMTAKSFGRATVSVSCTVNGLELGTSVNVEVVSSGLVEITPSSLTLGLSEDNNTATLTATAYEKGEENTGATIAWSTENGQDVIEFANGVVKAINAGETTVTATYVDNDGETKTDTLTVVVEPTIVVVDNSVELWKNEYTDGYPVDELGLDVAETVTGGYVVLNDELKATLPFADGKYDVSSLAVGEMKLYVETRNTTYQMTVTVFEKVYLNNLNFEAKLNNVEGATVSGDFVLSEDITLSGKWSNEAIFAGSLDGQGYSINGLNVSDTNGLFKATEKATIKNVALVGVTLGADSGAFAYTNKKGTTTFENVYVSLSSVSGDGVAAGLVADNSLTSGSKILAKNCVVYIPESITTTSSFVTNKSTTSNTVTVENCTFIGAIETVVGGDVTDGLTSTNSAICGAKEAHITYKTNWETLQVNAYNKDFRYALLTQENFATYMNVTGTITGLYELAEDIDLGGTFYGTANTFEGTLDGNGHTISGISAVGTTAKGMGGLFKTLRGTIKNVSIIGEHKERSGLIANTCDAESLIENVYVEASLLYKDSGSIVYMSAGALTMRNVVIKVEKTNANQAPGAVFAMVSMSKTLPTLENCYYIAANGMNPLGPRSATNTKEYGMLNGGAEAVFGAATTDSTITDYTVTTYTKTETDADSGEVTKTTTTLTAYTDDTLDNAKTAFDNAVTAGTVTLSDTLKAMMYPTNN